MKRAALLALLLLSLPSLANASIFNVWLVPGAVNSTTGYYSVQIWGRLLTDDPNAYQDLTGLCDFAFTVHTPGTVGYTEPRLQTDTRVYMNWLGPFQDGSFQVRGYPMDYDASANRDGSGVDGDLDAVESAWGDVEGLNMELGLMQADLIATQTWKSLQNGPVNLQVDLEPNARQWNPDMSRSFISTYTTGPSDPNWANRNSNYITSGATINLGSGVAPPQLDFSSLWRFNTPTPDATSAVVTLTATHGLTTVDSSTMYFGDGTSSRLTGNDVTDSHTYALAADEDYHIYYAHVEATNAGGTTDSGYAPVVILRAPQIVLKVNGQVASPGEVFDSPEFYGHNIVTLSLADSTGFIEYFSMSNPATGWSWSGQTWTGEVKDLWGSDVTFTVSNIGTGPQTDSITVQFAPEPATLALLAIGGLAALRRRNWKN